MCICIYIFFKIYLFIYFCLFIASTEACSLCQQLILGPHTHINRDKQPSTLTPADSLQLVNQPSLLVFGVKEFGRRI